MRWERHAEFTTYTFLRQNKDEEPFAKTACSEVPKEWLRALPGLLLTAIKAEILDKGQSRPSDAELDKYFVSESLVSSLIGSNGAQRWTDMRIDKDGYIRSLIYDRGMSPRKAGRVLLRIFEIAVYRNLSLLALPLAREVSVKIALINSELAELTEELGQTNSAAAEKDLLRDLTRVSAEIETLASKTAYRFSATRAYYQIVLSRIAELKEIPVDPYQTISEFLDRRLAPAVRTCNSVADRRGGQPVPPISCGPRRTSRWPNRARPSLPP